MFGNILTRKKHNCTVDFKIKNFCNMHYFQVTIFHVILQQKIDYLIYYI